LTTREQAHRIYLLWDECARSGDIETLLSLYLEDGTFESPLVPVLMKRDSGICRGKPAMREFFIEGTHRRPNALVRWYRTDRYFFDGTFLVWEYPGQLPDGEQQIDLVEVMELRDGLIRHHRVYWGFRGVNELLRSQKAKISSTSQG
jgi:hypothetical protein